ncbi:GHKL domain-containing protein [Erwinia sp. CPCC 100877]|nr:GHKL domain-containing protein [Erwinia sp. CPCC 100877]
MATVVIGMLQVVNAYVNSKLLSKNLHVGFLECTYVLLAAFVTASTYPILGVYGSIVMITSMILINYYIHKKLPYTVGLVSYATIIFVLCDHLTTGIETNILGMQEQNFTFAFLLLHVGIQMIISFLICYCLGKLIQNWERKHDLSIENNSFIISLGFVTMLVYYASVYLSVFLGNTPELIQLNLLFFVGYLVVMLVVFFFYINAIRNQYKSKQKEAEYVAMRQYMESMEMQYKDIRKFRHDYQNILSSLDDYILGNDYNGLKEYYVKYIKPSSETISKSNFKLDALGNIHVRELKSILVLKLMSAQESEIDVSVEVKEVIKNIPVDPVILIRIMGIILDNAIEEVETLGNGLLSVALFEDETALQIIVKNTCREAIPRIHQLKKEGFSTKGEGRGLGLSNMADLINDCGNILSETIIEKDAFVQRLILNK